MSTTDSSNNSNNNNNAADDNANNEYENSGLNRSFSSIEVSNGTADGSTTLNYEDMAHRHDLRCDATTNWAKGQGELRKNPAQPYTGYASATEQGK